MRQGHPQFRIIRLFVWSLVIIGIVVGCRTAPKLEISDYNLGAPPTATMEGVTNAIKLAAAGLGWRVSGIRPGELEATLNVRRHKAVVMITYDRKVFSIIYKDSRNMKNEGTRIHNNYNGWVSRLAQMIQAQVSIL